MKSIRLFGVVLLLPLLCSAVLAAASDGKVAPAKPSLTMAGTEYLFRWSKGDQHEYTPRGQEDLTKWAEMVTLVYYPSVKDGDGLAAIANSLLELYKANRAVVVKTNSVPRTPTVPAEYLMIVLLPQRELIEAVFVRLKITAGVGTATIISHREYGASAGNAMSAWLQKNGPILEPALMNWDAMPTMDAMKK